MHGLELTRWILARALPRPLVLGVLFVLLASGTILGRLVELGVATHTTDFPALLGVSAFLAGICGTGLAATFEASMEPELAGHDPVRRTWTEWVPLWTVGLVAQLLVLLSGLLGSGGGLPARGAQGAALVVAAALSQLHLAAIALVLLRSRLPAGAMTLGLALITWPLAGLLRGSGLGTRAVRLLVDASASLVDVPSAPAALFDQPARVLAPLALVGLAVCTASPYPRRFLAMRGDRAGGRADG